MMQTLQNISTTVPLHSGFVRPQQAFFYEKVQP